MKLVSAILALVFAIQPCVVVARGQACEASGSGLPRPCESGCGGCPRSPKGECCCRTQPGKTPEPAAPAPPDDGARLTTALFVAASAMTDLPLPEDDDASLGESLPESTPFASDLTHNERLALHCISRR